MDADDKRNIAAIQLLLAQCYSLLANSHYHAAGAAAAGGSDKNG